MKYTNKHEIDPILAIWLATSWYNNGSNKFPDKTVYSATSLMKPIRQHILEKRLPVNTEIDISDLIASRKGTAIHDSIERAWLNIHNLPKDKVIDVLDCFGFNADALKHLVINPEEKANSAIALYTEQRYFKEIDDIVISGQIDYCLDGQLIDIKTTSTYTFMNQTKKNDYILQGSIYRWLAPDIITNDIMKISYVFTDWQKAKTTVEKNYPPIRVHTQEFDLLSLEETEKYILQRIKDIKENDKLNEPDILRCSDKDLWMSDPVYKYYSNPATVAKGGRATKNFDNLEEAQAHHFSKGKGVVITVPSQPKACNYCSAFDICSQRKEYFDDRP